jgi:hypothetical protein
MTKLTAIVLSCVSVAFGQHDGPLLRGLSVYAGDDETSYPILVRNSIDQDGKPVGDYGSLTIQFDILADEPPELKIRFYHCNRDWMVDDNLFVNDSNRNTSFFLHFRTSPGGVKGYSYRYMNKFPDAEDAVRFDYSGNWIFKVMNKQETIILAEGRFFVVDNFIPTSVLVMNDYLTSASAPFNQIHKVVARIKLPDEIDGYFYTTVDVYQNRRFSSPYRIDATDRDPYTHVDGLGTGERIFKINNIMPGNDYRVLDLSNVTRYPNGAVIRKIEGPDQTRLYWRTGEDNNGSAIRNRFTGLYSEYLDVLFRLDMPLAEYRAATHGERRVYLAGQFNFWNPSAEDVLAWDDYERAYVEQQLLPRGVYDYQYVTGIWDAQAQTVTDQDWIALEGNDWRTTNRYTVFVYYTDPRFGGFDRIAGMGMGLSVQTLPGSN